MLQHLQFVRDIFKIFSSTFILRAEHELSGCNPSYSDFEIVT